MKKLAAIIAIPVTASLVSLYLWAKIMEAFDDMLHDFASENIPDTIPDWMEHEDDTPVFIVEDLGEDENGPLFGPWMRPDAATEAKLNAILRDVFKSAPIIEATDESQRAFKAALDKFFADLGEYDEP